MALMNPNLRLLGLLRGQKDGKMVIAGKYKAPKVQRELNYVPGTWVSSFTWFIHLTLKTTLWDMYC